MGVTKRMLRSIDNETKRAIREYGLNEKARSFVVISLDWPPANPLYEYGVEKKKYEAWRIITMHQPYPAIFYRVFGPATQRQCEKWVASHCRESGEATTKG